jgi:N-acetylglucosaminyl-diphospho-decaprenol L-rhamnosyltransferase
MDEKPTDRQDGRPRVTALVIARNCAPQLQRCLEALERSAERSQLEILVVDNGSADGSADVPSDFPDVQTLRLPKNFGWTKAANIGIRTAKGDLLLFLPPHVEVEPDTIPQLAGRLEESDTVGGVCPGATTWYPLPDAQALKEACRTGSLPNPRRVPEDAAEFPIDYSPGSPILVRRGFVRGMNYFDERYGDHWSDLELCYQLRSSGKSILALPRVAVRYGAPQPPEDDPVHKADCVLGAATYLQKHFGSPAALKFRIAAAAGALVRAQFSELSAVVSGQKVDGSHVA